MHPVFAAGLDALGIANRRVDREQCVTPGDYEIVHQCAVRRVEPLLAHQRAIPVGNAVSHLGRAQASGLVAELNATWLPSLLTTVSLVADADLDVTDEVGAVAVRTRKASVEVKHQLRRWVTLLAGVSLESLDYVGAGLTEDKRNAHLGVEYDFNREWALLADYRRTDVISNDASRSYAEDLVTLGVRLQR